MCVCVCVCVNIISLLFITIYMIVINYFTLLLGFLESTLFSDGALNAEIHKRIQNAAHKMFQKWV